MPGKAAALSGKKRDKMQHASDDRPVTDGDLTDGPLSGGPRTDGAMGRGDVLRFLDDLGIKTATLAHPAVFTVAESTDIAQRIPGAHTKNLFLKDAKGRLFLITALGSARIDLKGLPKVLGSGRLSFGKPELMQAVLGVAPGAVTPLALINDRAGEVTFALDAGLLAYDIINCHPMENTATTSIARDDFLRFIRATGHEPQILDLGGVGAADREPGS